MTLALTFIRALESADQAATLEINSLHTPLTDRIWEFFSDKEVWYPLYAIVAAFLVWKLGWKRGLLTIAGVVLTIILCDQLANVVKDLADRVRPSSDPSMVSRGLHILERPSKSFSFFSAHSANAMGLASSTYVAMRLLLRIKAIGYAIPMYLWATLVSISRIFVGKHFLGDVIVGIIVGVIFGLAVALIVKIIAVRLK